LLQKEEPHLAQVYLHFKMTTLNWLQHNMKHIRYRDAQLCVTCIIAKYLVAYGERLPHTEHHFLAEAVLDGPIAAVR